MRVRCGGGTRQLVAWVGEFPAMDRSDPSWLWAILPPLFCSRCAAGMANARAYPALLRFWR